MISTNMHRHDCAQIEYRDCPAGKSLHDEKPNEHWWSGWPGAYCMKCGAEDKNEVCLAVHCECECHDEFWQSLTTHEEDMETAAAHNAQITGQIDTTVQQPTVKEQFNGTGCPECNDGERGQFPHSHNIPMPQFQPYELSDYEAFLAFVWKTDKPMRIDWNGMRSEHVTGAVNMLVEYVVTSNRDNAGKLIAFIQQLSRAMKLREKEAKAAAEAAADDLISGGVPKQDAAPSAAIETEVSPTE